MAGLIKFFVFYFLSFSIVLFVMILTDKTSETYGDIKKCLKRIFPGFINYHKILFSRLIELVKIIKRSLNA